MSKRRGIDDCHDWLLGNRQCQRDAVVVEAMYEVQGAIDGIAYKGRLVSQALTALQCLFPEENKRWICLREAVGDHVFNLLINLCDQV